MSRRMLQMVALAITGSIVLMTAWTLWMAARNVGNDEGISFMAGVALQGAIGGFIATKRPFHRVGWLILLFAFCFTFGEFARQYALYGVLTQLGSLPFARAMASPAYWIWFPGVFTVFVLIPLYYPTGRLVSPGWRIVVGAAVVAIIGITLIAALMPNDLETPGIPNPIGMPGMDAIASWLLVSWLAPALWLGMGSAALVSQIVRYRRADVLERLQIKWYAFALFFVLAANLVQRLVQGQVPEAVLQLLGMIGLQGLGVAIAVAVLRYRLYNIDVIINRTLVYGALTIVLGIIYVGSIVALQALARPLIGQSSLTIVASTLLIAALFQPLRQRIQTLIDRRFYRRRYDSQQVLRSFSQRLQHTPELATIEEYMLQVIDETMQPVFLDVWLHDATPSSRQRGR